ncbi:membrane protein [Beggiatoa sp. PS]|nr:membrane protein [Beggiatoa sp. PS]
MAKKIRYRLGPAAKLGLNIGLGLWAFVRFFLMIILAGLLFFIIILLLFLLFGCLSFSLLFGGFIVLTIVFDVVAGVEISSLVLWLCVVFFVVLFHYDVFWDVVGLFLFLCLGIYFVGFVYGVYFCFFEL